MANLQLAIKSKLNYMCAVQVNYREATAMTFAVLLWNILNNLQQIHMRINDPG